MIKFSSSIFCLFVLFPLFSQEDLYLKNETYTFEGVTEVFQELARKYPEKANYLELGYSDYGLPIPLFIMNKTGGFSKDDMKGKTVLLINNAIHPGEPCGVDACVKLSRELLETGLPSNVIIAIIPIYNVGGAHNRSCCSRANQDGPIEYGFRGNAKNLDLNRDFIKADSQNSATFYTIFHFLKPTVFVDTHTSNGADYQHSMTLITSQLNKMNPQLAEFTRNRLNPYLFKAMEDANYPMVPYMNTVKETPDDGIIDYLETPRYSTGYTNLFNTISFVTEAHMLKPYPVRVEATLSFLNHLIKFMDQENEALRMTRETAIKSVQNQTYLHLNWKLDTTTFDTLLFSGYAARYKKSEVTGNDRLYYDHASPYKKYIRYYNRYVPTDSARVPNFYVIPPQWTAVIALLKLNQVEVRTLKTSTKIAVETYEIIDYATKNTPYEGHYLHSNIKTKTHSDSTVFRAGVYIVPARNQNIRFIMETLEPRAVDSYFAWNYFDAILQQKEWFSAYVFEDEAAEILKNNATLRLEFERLKETDTSFAQSDFAQLYFIYKHSPNYENTANRYPIARSFAPLSSLQLY